MFTIEMQKMLEEVKRQYKRRKKYLGQMSISTTGTKISHGLGFVPDEFSITPLMQHGSAPSTWCHYQAPDAMYIYVKSSADGIFLVCVAGG